MHERDILLSALEKGLPEEREAYLQEVCAGDAPMRSRIEALLRASEVADSFLERPALETEVLGGQTDKPGLDDPEQCNICTGISSTILASGYKKGCYCFIIDRFFKRFNMVLSRRLAT